MADEFEGKPDPKDMEKLMKSSTFAEGLDRLDGKLPQGTSDEIPDQPDKPEIFDPPEHTLKPPQPSPTGDSETVTPEDTKDLPTNPPNRLERYRAQVESDLKNNKSGLTPVFNANANDGNSHSR